MSEHKKIRKVRDRNSKMVAESHPIADIVDGWRLTNGDLNLHVRTGIHEVMEIQIPCHKGPYPEINEIIGSDGVPFPQG